MKFVKKEYLEIYKILDEKLTKEESDLIKNIIQDLFKEKEDLCKYSLRVIDDVRDLQSLINNI